MFVCNSNMKQFRRRKLLASTSDGTEAINVRTIWYGWTLEDKGWCYVSYPLLSTIIITSIHYYPLLFTIQCTINYALLSTIHYQLLSPFIHDYYPLNIIHYYPLNIIHYPLNIIHYYPLLSIKYYPLLSLLSTTCALSVGVRHK